MSNERLLPRAGMLLMMMAGIMALVMPLTAMGRMDMVTICHVVGPPGAEQHITLVVAAPAVFGPAGHFNDNGSPRAGHEGDYLGPCIEDEDHTDTDSENSSNGEQETTNTGDHHHEHPDENDEMTSTTETTPTTSDDESGSDDESATNDESATVDSAVEDAADDENQGPGNVSDPVIADEAVAAVVTDSGRVGGETTRAAVETLPFTGPSTGLILPAVLMLIAGAMVVFGTTGPGPDAGAHVAAGRHRLGLRLRRGRHQSFGQ
jgi:hypothetical protein